LPTPYRPDPGSAIDVSFYGVIEKLFHQWDETDAGHALRDGPEHAGTFDAMLLAQGLDAAGRWALRHRRPGGEFL
jgi:hypothetical protein